MTRCRVRRCRVERYGEYVATAGLMRAGRGTTRPGARSSARLKPPLRPAAEAAQLDVSLLTRAESRVHPRTRTPGACFSGAQWVVPIGRRVESPMTGNPRGRPSPVR